MIDIGYTKLETDKIIDISIRDSRVFIIMNDGKKYHVPPGPTESCWDALNRLQADWHGSRQD